MSDEVTQFLQQVERLRGKQIEDDEMRAREREEFLAAKRERQARREGKFVPKLDGIGLEQSWEERARSISPQKSSPINTPSPRALGRNIQLSEATRLESPAPESRDRDALGYISSPTKENIAPAESSTKDMESGSPGRTNTMSWQRRPNSRAGARPLSMMATQNATQRFTSQAEDPTSPAAEQTLSREDIAKTLGLKDPSWFRQTADRGQGSAAYRKNQVEDDERLDMSSLASQLPGMTARKPSDRSTFMSPSQARLAASPVPLTPAAADEAAENPSDLPSDIPSGRTSPMRSASPTKGMGGFVQSAMLKRNDSIKRWSVTSPPTLSRADSVSNGPGGRGSPIARQRTGTFESLEGSSSNLATDNRVESVQPSPSDEKATTPEGGLPSSPSKGLDARRWSPTKSSWLDNALNKPPESPKPGHRAAASQPDWMADLNKMKQNANNGSASSSRPTSPHKHQVSVGGLMRSIPFEGRGQTNTTGLGGIYSPPPGGNRPAFGHKPSFSVSSSRAGSVPTSPIKESVSIDSAADAQEQENELKKSVEPETEVEPVAAPAKHIVVGPPPVKSKPATPPKKTDFRAGLKSRAPDSGPKAAEQPEFRNALGNLRRTKTENYVAPDELKANVLRGKAGLTATGGPQKTERKDEFKDAILKKKDDFKKAQADGKGVSRSSTILDKAPIPEGLAKRAELGRSVAATAAASKKPESATPAAAAGKPTPAPKRVPSTSTQPPKRVPSTSTQAPKRVPSTSTPAKPSVARKPSTSTPAKSPASRTPSASTPAKSPAARVPSSSTPAKSPVVAKSPLETRRVSASKQAVASPAASIRKTSGQLSSPAQTRPGVAKLADRFNPGLAGMLARGPPPMAAGKTKNAESDSAEQPGSGSPAEPTAPGPQLTHMTKGRARGPKRKTPTSAAKTATVPASKPVAQQKAEPANEPARIRAQSLDPDTPLQSIEEADPVSIPDTVAEVSQETVEDPVKEATKELTADPEQAFEEPTPPPPARSPSRPAIHKQVAAKAAATRKPSLSKESKPAPSPTQNRQTQPSPRAPVASPRVPPKSPVLEKSPAPVQTPTKAAPAASLARTPTTTASPSRTKRETTPSMAAPSRHYPPPGSPERRPTLHGPRKMDVSRPRSRGQRPPSVIPETMPSPSAVSSPSKSPMKHTDDINSLFTDFFGPPRPRRDFRVDTAAILTHHVESGAKVHTSDVQMFRISGDGKKSPIRPEHERVLFDEEMYICAHTFTNSAGKKDFAVYFWIGDEVPEASAQDAGLFAHGEAKKVGSRMVKIQQGKETSEFLQALGGVMIVRRGSSERFDSLAPHMLCGRRFLGQVAFDEVEMTASSLCSGFPYLITDEGRCYLWKGKGSDVDELSAAKLVGMELATTGELLEYEEGSEPSTFWGLFGDESKAHSADHWRLKPNYSKYGSRLFCSDADARYPIVELSPFNQVDLSPLKIYVLDAFFEMYVIVGSGAQSQYASFRNALDFAQEYAILSASVEDRPFVPVSTVVMEGIPRDMKRVFRKWSEARSPTVTNTYAGLKRGKSLRIVSLTQALRALQD